VYSFASIREYINAVYLRGVLMLHDLREALGTQAFYEWLRAYALAGKDKIATPTLFWSLLSDEQQALVAPIRARYGG
jgi:aminopeptidase N